MTSESQPIKAIFHPITHRHTSPRKKYSDIFFNSAENTCDPKMNCDPNTYGIKSHIAQQVINEPLISQ